MAGVAAAYLTIGAPMFIQHARPRSLRMDFAHEVKVAFSCYDQAQRLNSQRYRDAFDVYGLKFTLDHFDEELSDYPTINTHL